MKLTFMLPAFLVGLVLINIQGQIQVTSERASAIRYKLNVKVLPEARRLEVNGTMLIPASSSPRAFIELTMNEVMQDLHIEVVTPGANAGVARLEKLRTEGGWLVPGTPGAKSHRDIVYGVYPRQTFLPGQEIELRFSYSSNDNNGVIYYVGPEVTFVSGWGTTWYPQFSDPSKAIGSLKISVPPGETAIAEGERHSSSEEEAQGVFIFDISHETYFSFASGKYTAIRREGPIPISVYLLRGRENMSTYLNGVARIFSALEREFGPYRFKEFRLVEVPRDLAKKAFFNGASLQGLAFVNSNGFNVPTPGLGWFGHEFGHNWWPHVVSLKRPGGRFIEEMLAEYGGLRVVETIAGAAAAERYRRYGYEPDPIYSALAYFKKVGAGVDGKLGDLPADEAVRDIAYNKGFLVWEMLSREIGRTRFQRALRSITKQYAFKQLTLQEFWRAIESDTGRNLDWFYEQWFERTGAPDFQITWKQEGHEVRGAVTQTAPYYRATLQIEIEGDRDRRSLHSVKVGGVRTEFRFPANFHVRSVALDPHYLVLRWTPEYRAAADAARLRGAPSP